MGAKNAKHITPCPDPLQQHEARDNTNVPVPTPPSVVSSGLPEEVADVWQLSKHRRGCPLQKQEWTDFDEELQPWISKGQNTMSYFSLKTGKEKYEIDLSGDKKKWMVMIQDGTTSEDYKFPVRRSSAQTEDQNVAKERAITCALDAPFDGLANPLGNLIGEFLSGCTCNHKVFWQSSKHCDTCPLEDREWRDFDPRLQQGIERQYQKGGEDGKFTRRFDWDLEHKYDWDLRGGHKFFMKTPLQQGGVITCRTVRRMTYDPRAPRPQEEVQIGEAMPRCTCDDSPECIELTDVYPAPVIQRLQRELEEASRRNKNN